MTGRLSGL